MFGIGVIDHSVGRGGRMLRREPGLPGGKYRVLDKLAYHRGADHHDPHAKIVRSIDQDVALGGQQPEEAVDGQCHAAAFDEVGGMAVCDKVELPLMVAVAALHDGGMGGVVVMDLPDAVLREVEGLEEGFWGIITKCNLFTHGCDVKEWGLWIMVFY